MNEIDGNQVVWNANGGDARIYGAEASLGARLGLGLVAEAAVTWTRGDELLDAEARAADPAGRSTVPLSKIPPVYGRASLRWQGPVGSATTAFAESYLLWATRQGRLSELDRTDVRIPPGGTPGWATWNLRGGVSFSEVVKVVLTLENLTDSRYKYHVSGFWMPGTSALLALDVAY
jgi:iron complex outermembrane receptor protein/hemoglobin/transferrin/lactoferrin receptor protein